MNKINKEENYLKELDEISKKYSINESDLRMIKDVIKEEIPDAYIKNSKRINFCIKQKEYCGYLLNKIFDKLEELHLNKEEYNGRIVISGDEQDYKHKFTVSATTPQSVIDKYNNRFKESIKIIEEIINKLMITYKYFYSEAGKQIKGNQGENIVKKYFSMFSEKYPSRMNVVLPIEDEFAKTSELDSLIVTSKGILVCEIKNWGNENDSIYISEDDTWYINRNGKKEKQKNPFEQNIRHSIALEKYLKQNNITCKVIPVVIIADSRTDIKNNSHKAVLKSSAVYEYIENQPLPITINEAKQKEILQLLDKLDTEENEFACKDLISVSEEYENAIYKAFKLRETEYKLEQTLFDKCEEIIKAYNSNRTKLLIIIFIILGILCITGLIVFRGFVKFVIGLLLLGVVCGGLSSK